MAAVRNPAGGNAGRSTVITAQLPSRAAPAVEQACAAPTRPLKLAYFLALAHSIEQSLDSGAVFNQAMLAENLGCTRTRITQLLGLLSLAPDIQEEILLWEVPRGHDPVTERQVRPISAELDWARQRILWSELKSPRED